MKHLPVFLSCFCLCLCLCLQPAYADDDEDFEIQEEGQLFDYPRTGLLYKRALYDEYGDKTTYIPYYPTAYNDTRDTAPWKLYISHWEQDPPSFVTVFIMDDSPNLNTKVEVDVQISIAQLDRLGHRVYSNRKLVTDIPLVKGMNRIPMNIHNYKGDIVSAQIIGSRPKTSILPIEGTGRQD